MKEFYFNVIVWAFVAALLFSPLVFAVAFSSGWWFFGIYYGH